MSIVFDYTTFYNFYTNLGAVTDKVSVKVYDADYSAIKYDHKDTEQPFTYQGFVTREVPNNHPLITQHPGFFPYGCFIIFPEQQKPKKALYLVHPELHTVRMSGEAILTGDHYSFVINKGAVSEKALNFHKTEYVPSHVIAKNGKGCHYFNPLPKSFGLSPASLKDRLKHYLKPFAEPIYTMFSLPWRGQVNPPLSGGTARQSIVRRRTARHKNRSFNDLWRSLPIHKMVVICIKDLIDNTELMHVTVFAYDRLHHKTPWRTACYLRLPVSNMHNLPKLEAAIAQAFEGLQWDDFKEAPEPEFPL
jgi:hypothetical protein